MKLIESALASARLARLLCPPNLDEIEKQRQLLKAFLLLLIVAILAGFGGYNFILGEKLLAAAAALIGTGFLFGLVNFKNDPLRILVCRLALGFLTAIFLYLAVTGKHSGTTILWMYTLPPILFFLLGRAEGLTWIVPVALISAVILLWPELLDTYPYESNFKVRFLVSLTVVTIFSYAVEMFRELAHKKLLEEKARLEKALDEIRLLRGILPICSFCKQIRDQDGNWSQLEAYFRERGEIDFSHGICPDCCRQHYPELERTRSLAGF